MLWKADGLGVGRELMCVTFGVLVCLVCLRVSHLNSNLTVITTSLTEDVFIDSSLTYDV